VIIKLITNKNSEVNGNSTAGKPAFKFAENLKYQSSLASLKLADRYSHFYAQKEVTILLA
jgi:hypothetical protein